MTAECSRIEVKDGKGSAIFSSVEGVAWHGLGMPIPQEIRNNPKKMAALCGADFTVEKRACYYHGAGGRLIKAPNRDVIVRADTHEMLSIASQNRYNLDYRQPVDMFEAFRDQLNHEGFEISHAAVLNNGADIVVCAILPPEFDIQLAKKDLIKSYITAATGYNGHSTKVMKGSIRVVCQNTLMASLREAIQSGKIRSIKASQLLEVDSIANLVKIVNKLVDSEKATFKSLADTRMTANDIARYFADVMGVNQDDIGKVAEDGRKVVSTKTENLLIQLADAYQNAPGAKLATGTAWGALNAVTYYATHKKIVRDTSGSGANAARLSANMNGDAAKLKLRALELAAAYSDKVAIAA